MTIEWAVLELRTTIIDDNDDERTISLDLLAGSDGFWLDTWTPTTAEYKDGGVFQDSPFADGRKLVFRRFANATETMGLKQKSSTSDGAASAGQELERWLELAADYRPTDFSKYPVYLAMLPRGATEEQYALIAAGRIPELQNPTTSPFYSRLGKKHRSTWEVTLVLERGHWTENPPGQGTAVPIYNTSEFDGVTFGTVDDAGATDPVTTEDLFLANKHVYSNLTNIHIGTGGSNLINAAMPFNIFGVGAYTYFGVDTSVAGAAPFCCLIFDIANAAVGTSLNVDIETWTGASWSNIGHKDNTEDFSLTGVRGIYWTPSSMQTTSPGGGLPTGWWVRIQLTGTLTTAPQQQNRNIYTASVPYAEIDKGTVKGEIHALMKAYLYDGSPSLSASAQEERYANWVMLATRSISRGENFTPYLNITYTAEDRPSGTSIATRNGLGISSATHNRSPTGRAISWTPGTTSAVSILERIAYSFLGTSPTDNIAKEFAGRYRVFMRVIQDNGNAGEMFAKLSFETATPGLNEGVVFHETKEVYTTDIGVLEVFDFGEVTIKENMHGLYIVMWTGKTATAASTHVLYMCDIVLMPVDEYSAVVDSRFDYPYTLLSIFGDGSTAPIQHVRLELDGIKQGNETRAVADLTESVTSYPLTIVSGRHRLTANKKIRMWSFMRYNDISGAAVVSRLKLEKNQQYLTYRGAQ